MSDKKWLQIPGNGLVVPHFYRAHVETVGAGKDRTLSIEGKIQSVRLDRGSMPKVQGITQFDHRGHLIAFRFGGPNHPANLAPMHGMINMSGGLWYQMEQRISDYLGNRPGEMKVIVQYDDSTDLLRPRAFHVHVKNHSYGEFFHRIYNFNPHLEDKERGGL